MATAAEHYEQHLGPVYAWMSGGLDAVLAQGAAALREFAVELAGGHAVDLGCGIGAHAIPLATMGYRVTAIDSCAHLLAQLDAAGQGLGIRITNADIALLGEGAFHDLDLVLCMGDTITHLPTRDHAARVMERAARWLKPGGRLLVTFRDYVRAPGGDQRFIPVRSDPDRIHTCFVETQADHVLVHDLLHERSGEGSTWRLRVSSYPKLRLAPQWLRALLEGLGLEAQVLPAPRGMTAVSARKRER